MRRLARVLLHRSSSVYLSWSDDRVVGTCFQLHRRRIARTTRSSTACILERALIVNLQDVDLPVAVAVALKRDPFSIWRPAGLNRIRSVDAPAVGCGS